MNNILVKRLLKDLREFRNLVGKPFDRGFMGELLVYEHLLRTYKDGAQIDYLGSARRGRDFDLRLSDGRTIKIEVKSTTERDKAGHPKWVRQNARKFCDIEIDKDAHEQRVSLSRHYNPHLFYFFIDVESWTRGEPPRLFVFSEKEAKSVLGRKYRKAHQGDVRRNDSADFWIEYDDVKNNEVVYGKKYYL